MTLDPSNTIWRKSSHSSGQGGQCVEVADLTSAPWTRSSRSSSQGDQCVEVAGLTKAIGIRDSKNPEGAALLVSRAAFGDLVARVKRGGHDL